MPDDSRAELVHQAIQSEPILLKLLAFVIGTAMDNAEVTHLTKDEEAAVFALLAADVEGGLIIYK